MTGINLSKESDAAPTVCVNRFGEDETVVQLDGPTSVSQCLARAGIETPLPGDQAVSVNGSIVKDLSTIVEAGSIIVVAGKIANG